MLLQEGSGSLLAEQVLGRHHAQAGGLVELLGALGRSRDQQVMKAELYGSCWGVPHPAHPDPAACQQTVSPQARQHQAASLAA